MRQGKPAVHHHSHVGEEQRWQKEWDRQRGPRPGFPRAADKGEGHVLGEEF